MPIKAAKRLSTKFCRSNRLPAPSVGNPHYCGLECITDLGWSGVVQRVGHPISFHFDAYPVTPSFASGSHESVWWLAQPTSDGYLIVSNLSASPGNDCHLQSATDQTYVYTVYTHPDKTAVVRSDGLVGTAVGETFNPAPMCTNITGNGGLQPSGQILDHLASGCSSAPLTCTQTSTQSLSVAGYSVRTNTLQWTSNGVIYTSNGPTQ